MSEFILMQYFIALLVTGVINLSLCLLVIARGFNRRINQIFALYSLSLALWSIFEAFGITSANQEFALLFWRVNHIGVIFIPIFLTHFIFLFLNIKGRKEILIPISYAIAFIFLILDATPLLILNVVPKFSFRYFINPGYLYYLFFALWIYWAIYGNVELLKEYFRTTGYRREQMKYFCMALLLSYIGGVPNFLPTFNIEIPMIMPYATYAIPIYAVIAAYSIIRYKLIDIKLAVTRVGIFVTVYSVVLGVPFLIGLKYLGNGLWVIPTSIAVLLATAGPYTYLFLQKKAEDHILQEENRVQDLLAKASLGMRMVRELDRLLKLVVDILGKTLRLENVAIYLIDTEKEQYTVKAKRAFREFSCEISQDNELIKMLGKARAPLVLEEIEMLSAPNRQDKYLKGMIEGMKDLAAQVVVPMIENKDLLGFIVLGKRQDKESFSSNLVNVLLVLGDHAALAIENCRFWEAETRRMEEEGVKDRMVTLDYMASSMAHEIDNPIHVMRQHIGLLKMRLSRDHRVSMPDDLKTKVMSGIEWVENSCQRVSEMINAVLDFSRMGKPEQIKPIDVAKTVDEFLVLLDFQFRQEQIVFEKKIAKNLPSICWNKVHFDEIIMNFANNAIHAVKGLENKKIILKIFKKKNEDVVRIELSDNGYGIPAEKLNNIFAAHTTTKGSGEGTGLGLFRIRKIVDFYKGKVWAESEGEGRGSTFCVEVLAYKENNGDLLNDE